ncbi:hypothetical protein BU15DRAFT_66230 [Melanogaster broomeanus]|nr:hypothetical protein BU15DRAFT_66230 [Melanogaster broomeanus]
MWGGPRRFMDHAAGGEGRTIRAESSAANEDEMGRIATRDGKESGQKSDFVAKSDSLDNMFIDEHYKVYQYEDAADGSTKLGYPGAPYVNGLLGSGVVFPDEAPAIKELAANVSRIEGWVGGRASRTSTVPPYVMCDTAVAAGRPNGEHTGFPQVSSTIHCGQCTIIGARANLKRPGFRDFYGPSIFGNL